jgi:hypothetical protein
MLTSDDLAQQLRSLSDAALGQVDQAQRGGLSPLALAAAAVGVEQLRRRLGKLAAALGAARCEAQQGRLFPDGPEAAPAPDRPAGVAPAARNGASRR